MNQKGEKVLTDLMAMASKALENLEGKVPDVAIAQLYLTGMRASEIKQLRTEVKASYLC